MAGQFDVHIMTLPVVLTGATEIPLVQVPASGGGITVLSATLFNAGTSVGGLLVTMSNAGTPALSGTIGSFAGTVLPTPTIPANLTISDSWVAGGEWIGFDQTSGTVPVGSHIAVTYVMGK